MADTSSPSTSAETEIPGTPWWQWAIMASALVVAFGALALGVAYQAPTDGGPVLSGGAVDGGGDRNDDALGTEELDINPIESFLPRSGIGSTCTEEVGVDLIPGWSALLTINGQKIAIEDMNPNPLNRTVDDPALSAGGSRGQYTWGPEPSCPNGSLLRPRGNTVDVCVFRTIEGAASCRTESFTFDAL